MFQNSEEVRSNALDGELKDLKAKFEEVKSERDQLHSDLESRTNELEKIRTDLIDADAKVSVVHISMEMIHVILMIHLYDSPNNN